MTDEAPIKKPSKKLSQADVPAYPLKEALRVAEALRDEYGKQPTRPLMVAKAIGMSPTSGPFRMITGAAVAYGLTDNGGQSTSTIGLTPLGKRAVAPTTEGDDLVALREAVLKPRIMREFLTKYDSSKLPTKMIALNVLEEMGVPEKAAARAYEMILENAEYVGFLEELNGSPYVNMEHASAPKLVPVEADPEEPEELEDFLEVGPDLPVARSASPASNTLATNKRVFISHGKNKEIVNQLKEVLSYGGFDPIVSVDKEATATPVPDKVLDDMRTCGAAIVHVGTDESITDAEGNVRNLVNQNVLIEIGAALALYKRNFILLVESGVTLPSNLQGLYEVRYTGSSLDYDATMKLLRAFNEFKSNAVEGQQ